MSRLVLGTVQFGTNYGINNQRGQPDSNTVFRILDLAHQNGITTLDTAPAYGNAESLVGQYHQMTGRSFKVNTKFSLASHSVQGSLQSSLRSTGSTQVQVLFYHRFEDVPGDASVRDKLKALKQSGQVKEIGVSVYDNMQFEACISQPGIDVIQFPFNLLDNAVQRGSLIKKAVKAGKRLQVRSVFLQGLFFKEESTWPQKLQPLKKYVGQVKALAEKSGLAVYEMALGYALAKEDISEIVIGVDDETQLRYNLRIASSPLDTAVVEAIDDIDVKEVDLLNPVNWK